MYLEITEGIKKILRGEASLLDAWYWVQGTYRAYGYYYYKFSSDFPEYNTPVRREVWRFMRDHIKGQLSFRVNSVNSQCYDSGSCISCSCKTPDVFFADKACNELCYPAMLNKEQWNKFINHGGVVYYNKKTEKGVLRGIFHKGVGRFVLVYSKVDPNYNDKFKSTVV